MLRRLAAPLRVWRRLAGFVERDRWLLVAIGATSVVRGFGEAALLYLLVQAATAIASGTSASVDVAWIHLDEVGTTAMLQVGFALLVLLAAVAGANAVSVAAITSRTLNRTRRLLVDGFLDAAWAVQSREPEGRLQQVLHDHVLRVGVATLQVCTGLGSALTFLAYMASAVAVDPAVALGDDVVLEGDGVVSAEQAVYDPQDAASPQLFAQNGSSARRLALVLNRHEAQLLVGHGGRTSDLAQALLAKSSAEAIVIKDGARGALVLENARVTEVPAYQSASVWKIGSGDNFAAHFSVRWMLQGKSAAESADLASRATAYYCETRGFADDDLLAAYLPRPVQPSSRYLAGYAPSVYLAGPFFNLAQVWLVEQARSDLQAAGLRVFSPYHDVGIGVAQDVVAADLKGINESDLVFAIVDGMDPGTVFEIGYARATGKPVIVYCEMPSGENHKMLEGTDCTIVNDYVSAVYRTVWTACAL